MNGKRFGMRLVGGIKNLNAFMKTCFASKVIIFQKTLKYANVINLCYITTKFIFAS
jgi:hypothetical protein